MRERSSRFVNFFVALGRGVLEEATFDIVDVLGEGAGGILGVLAIAAVSALIVCLVYGFFKVGYELMFDPNASDVASRLAAISISPDKWN